MEEIRAFLLRAEAAERGGDPARLAEGLSACAQAIARLNDTPAGDRGADRLVAAAWLKRGHLLQLRAATERRPEDLVEALRCHDVALRVLEAHAAGDIDAAEARAGAWINRGNVLQRLGSEVARLEAARCYETVLTELAPRLAERPGLGLVTATARINLAVARRAEGAAAEALELLREALAGLAGREVDDEPTATVGLRAREAAVDTLAAQLAAEGDAPTGTTRERVAEAAALVGEAMELMRIHGRAAGAGMRGAGLRLFALGAELYSVFGDGQLAPYLEAYACAPEFPERAGPARAAVARARAELMGRGFQELTGEAAERAAGQLAALREVEARLPAA